MCQLFLTFRQQQTGERLICIPILKVPFQLVNVGRYFSIFVSMSHEAKQFGRRSRSVPILVRAAAITSSRTRFPSTIDISHHYELQELVSVES